MAEHRRLFEQIRPSFFEITVALAFYHFAQSNIDLGVIETGLGGRLDSTNIITPQLCIITNISFDHQQMLGNTLPLIAAEKAGIIKTKVPVVIGETASATRDVFLKTAKTQEAPIVFADQQFRVEYLSERGSSHTIYRVWRGGKILLDDLAVNLHGPFQSRNLATLFQALEVLADRDLFHWQEDRLRYALEELRSLTRYLGRWQILASEPLTITDSAHNEAGLTIVLQALQKLPFAQLHIVLGVVNDKDLEKVLPLFPADAKYYFARPDIPRGMSAKALQEQAKGFDLLGRSYVSVRNAWRAAKRRAGAEDVIFIGGSTFVVAEVV